jgi:phosphatidylglycerophosphate synthase
MRLYSNIAEMRHLAQPSGESWAFRRYRSISIFLSLPLARLGVSPNFVTIVWIFVGCVGAAALGFPQYGARVLGACLLLLSELLDFVDGEVARLTQQTTNCGAFLDIVGHDLLRRVLFLSLAYQVFRAANNNVGVLFLGFSAAVFVSAYQTAPDFAESAGLGRKSGPGEPTRAGLENTSLLRKLVKPVFLLMRNVKVVIFIGAIFDRLIWVVLYYAIAAPFLFLWRIYRLSDRLS